MRAAQTGDRVRIRYVAKLRDGSLAEKCSGDDALEFVVGNEEVIPGLEELVEGMRAGERRTRRLSPDRAHGRHRNDLLLAVERERFPSHIDPYSGQRLRMRRGGRPETVVLVVATTGDMVLLDTNHPLAGKELTIEVELLEIVETPTEVTC